MQLIVPDKVYDILKWVAMLLLPAVTALYYSLAQTWGWPDADKIVASLAAVNTFIGIILGVSTIQFNNKLKKTETQ